MFAKYQGDYKASQERLEEAAELYRTLDDPAQLAAVLNILGGTLERLRNYPRAEECFLEAHDLWQKLGDARSGLPLMNMAIVAERESDHRRAKELYRRALAIGKQFNEPFLCGNVLANLSFACIRSGADDEAAEVIEQLLRNQSQPRQ